MKHLAQLVLGILLLTATQAQARESYEYDLMTWQTVATVSVASRSQVEIDVDDVGDVRGQFVRLIASAACGHIGVGLAAEGRPFTPRMVYDRNANVWTPATQRLHWYIKPARDVQFAQIWILPGTIGSGRCDITVEVAAGTPDGDSGD